MSSRGVRASARAVASVALLVCTVGASSAASEALPTHYMYFDEPVELTLDVSRLAVHFDTELTAAGRIEAAAASGAAALETVSTGAPGWYLIDLAVVLDDLTDAGARVAALGDSPQIDFASPVFFGRHGGWVIVTPEILVRFSPEQRSAAETHLPMLASTETIVTRDFAGMAGAYKLRSSMTSGFDVLAAANRLHADPSTMWAEPAFQFQAFKDYIPNDPLFGQLWGIRNTGQLGGTPDMDMDGDEAWDLTMGDASIGVLVMDDGVNLLHPDLNLIPGEDFTNDPAGAGGAAVNPCDDHGTLVSGCIAAVIDNGLYVVGISPHCPVAPARCFISTVPCDGTGTGNSSWLIEAVGWGLTHGCRVSNLSWTTPESTGLADQYAETHAAGMVHFESAGNDGEGTIAFPGTLAEVHSVGAVNRFGARAWFSNYGNGMSFMAPGQDITTTSLGGATATVGGTSFSAPYAAGVAALVISAVPAMLSADVDQRLYDTCMDLGDPGYDIQFGYGLVNARQAIDITEYYRMAMALTSPHTQIGTATEVVSFAGEIANLGITDDTYDITVMGVPAGWAYTYTTPAGTFNGPSSLPLLANDVAAFTIDIDSQGNPGTATITFRADSQGDPTRSASVSFQKLNNAQVLLVDADDGGEREVVVEEALAAAGVLFGTWDTQWGDLTVGDLETAAAAVVWIEGDQLPTLTANDRAAISGFMDGGGKIFVSGQNIAEELWTVDIMFVLNYLHSVFSSAGPISNFVEGVAGDAIGDGLSFGLNGSGPTAQTGHDVITAGFGAELVFHYDVGPTFGAGIKWTDGTTQLVFTSFGYEGIFETAARNEVMARVLTWFGIESTGIAEAAASTPRAWLAQNAPNPFNPATTIRYELTRPGRVRLRIVDVSGRVVRVLVDDHQQPALHAVRWDGRDASGRIAASGVYFYTLEAEDIEITHRMVLIR